MATSLRSKNGKKDNEDKEVWLSVLGQVYNVTVGGTKYYYEGNGYHVFAAKDSSVSFMTGNFTDEEAAKSTLELTDAQLNGLYHEWLTFYLNEKRYPFVGLLVGRFYDEEGMPTEELNTVNQRVESYEVIKKQKAAERKAKREKRKKEMMMVTRS